MKNILWAFTMLLLLVGCKPDPFESIGKDYVLAEGIKGEWVVNVVEVVDERSPIKLTRDMSDYFVSNITPVELSFNTDAMTYAAQNGVGAGLFFGTSGSFFYDDPEFPSQLSLVSATDTFTFKFNQLTREIDRSLNISYTRSACEKNYVTYKYTFLRK